jgi:hypothetical protein
LTLRTVRASWWLYPESGADYDAAAHDSVRGFDVTCAALSQKWRECVNLAEVAYWHSPYSFQLLRRYQTNLRSP